MANPLTPAESAFVALDREYHKYKEFMKKYRAAANNIVAEHKSPGKSFQDDEGVVYQTALAKGRYVEFYDYEILRTRREGEKSGTLSLVKAREAGFTVEGEGPKSTGDK